MIPRTSKLGLNVTKRCNWRCAHCFFRHEAGYFVNEDVSLPDIMAQVEAGKARGSNHAYIIGWGESTLWPHLVDWIDQCKAIGVSTSIISNGTASIRFYENLYNHGLNHLHLSVHGFGDVINAIAESQIADKKQTETLTWLKESELPWRSNTTLQLLNYQHLPEIFEKIIDYGSRHLVICGFLPHYGWETRLRDVAVAPAISRPFIEAALDKAIAANRWLTLRYFPYCHLRQDLWPYITNANMVVFDNGEYEFENSGSLPDDQLMALSNHVRDTYKVQGEPCKSCAAFIHCGGWNKVYAAAFDGAGLTAQAEAVKEFGYYWNQNPFNTEFKGYV